MNFSGGGASGMDNLDMERMCGPMGINSSSEPPVQRHRPSQFFVVNNHYEDSNNNNNGRTRNGNQTNKKKKTNKKKNGGFSFGNSGGGRGGVGGGGGDRSGGMGDENGKYDDDNKKASSSSWTYSFPMKTRKEKLQEKNSRQQQQRQHPEEYFKNDKNTRNSNNFHNSNNSLTINDLDKSNFNDDDGDGNVAGKYCGSGILNKVIKNGDNNDNIDENNNHNNSSTHNIIGDSGKKKDARSKLSIRLLVIILMSGVLMLFILGAWQWRKRNMNGNNNGRSRLFNRRGNGGGDMDFSRQLLLTMQDDFVEQLQALHALSVTVSSTAVSPSTLTAAVEENGNGNNDADNGGGLFSFSTNDVSYWCPLSDKSLCTTWPFVVVPILEEYVLASFPMLLLRNSHGGGSEPREEDGYYNNDGVGGGVKLFPIVTQGLRQAWMNFVINNAAMWIEQSQQTQDDILHNGGTGIDSNHEYTEHWFDNEWNIIGMVPADNIVVDDTPTSISGDIFRFEPGTDGVDSIVLDEIYDDRPLLPQWQCSPISPTLQSQVNMNLITSLPSSSQQDDGADVVTSLLTGEEAILIESPVDATALDPGFYPDGFGNKHHPSSLLLYPVKSKSNTDVVVAQLGLDTSWKTRLKNACYKVLEDNNQKLTTDIVVSIQNDDWNNGEPYKYHLMDDCHVEWVLVYDDTNYQFAHEIILGENDNNGEGDLWDHYTGIPLSKELGLFSIKATSSTPTVGGGDGQQVVAAANGSEYQQQQEQQVRTFTMIVCIGSIILLILFTLYVCLVKRRQRGLEKADAVVSSLFPSHVKEVLYEQEQNKQHPQYPNRRNSNENKPRYFGNGRRNSNEQTAGGSGGHTESMDDSTSFNNFDSMVDGGDDRSAISSIAKGPPIAEHYDTSTILFADIAGFTKWSSDRRPADVFEFLEVLYGNFDQAARANGVMKIEVSAYIFKLIRWYSLMNSFACRLIFSYSFLICVCRRLGTVMLQYLVYRNRGMIMLSSWFSLPSTWSRSSEQFKKN